MAKPYDLVLMERSPIEGIETFAYKDLCEGRLTIEEYWRLLTKAKSITPFNVRDSIRIRGMKDRDENKKRIFDIIRRMSFKAIRIELDVKPEQCMKNIEIRNRECESCYTLTDLEDLHYFYHKYWNKLND